MAEPRIAAQLYTLRDYLKTVDDIKQTMPKVAKLGYKAVQTSGLGPIDDQELRSICDDAGLEIVATHVGLGDILEKTDAVIAQHQAYGCRHVGIGGMGFGGSFNEPGAAEKAIEQLNEAASKLAAADMTFSYHNHNHELEPFTINGERKPLLQHLIDGCDKALCFEIDVYWIQAGGGDPALWVEKVSGRCPLLHYKDMTMVGRTQHFAPVGAGNLNWDAINKATRASGCEFVIAEQDRCEVEPTDPFEALKLSFDNMKSWGFAV